MRQAVAIDLGDGAIDVEHEAGVAAKIGAEDQIEECLY